MNALRILALCVLAAVGYGILHDQITVRISLEYFTVGHPPIFGDAPPTLLALGWGVVATWWVGALLGIPLAIAARAGGRPRRTAGSLVRPILKLLAWMGGLACVAGLVGAYAGGQGWVFLVEPLASELPADRHLPFLIALWAHSASYAVGFLGGLLLIVKTWRSWGGPTPTATQGLD